MEDKRDTVVIIGAGPAGLTAAYELATKSDKHIVVLEADHQVGGISKTVDYKGNKIDIGGHRFFSKSDWVLDWWQQFLPILTDQNEIATTYQKQHKQLKVTRAADPDKPHMLIRPRKSRIYFKKRLFSYPIKLNLNTLIKIGFWKSLKIFFSLLYSRIAPRKKEENLEDFFINRFGKTLYATFFRDYTYKVWGKPCHEISAEWGRQRVQDLSLTKIIKHYLTALFYPQRHAFGNKQTEQTLTEFFLYPQKGPGQLWETVAERCTELGVDIRLNHRADNMVLKHQQVTEVGILNLQNQEKSTIQCEQVISTMPVKNLIQSLGISVPAPIHKVANSLEYRDFMIVGLLLNKMAIDDLDDNWLYIQDNTVKAGRLQLFHNWSPYMTTDANQYWIGAEYFCQEGDDLWQMPDKALIELAAKELAEIGLIDAMDVLDATVVRMPKAYPSYVGAYQDFDQVKEYFNELHNLYLIGRNGTHRYNNQDHSMLTALEAVNNILSSKTDKENIWSVNTGQTYHEAVER